MTLSIYSICNFFLKNSTPIYKNPQHQAHLAQMVKNIPVIQETNIQSLGWEDSLGKEMATHSSIPASILAWKLHGQRNLAGYCPWGYKE